MICATGPCTRSVHCWPESQRIWSACSDTVNGRARYCGGWSGTAEASGAVWAKRVVPEKYEELRRGTIVTDTHNCDCIRSEAEEGLARYAVILRETGDLIGFCGFKKASDCIDFGRRYTRRVWGNGYATEAAVAVLDYGMNTLKLSGIISESAVENVGSVRVIERIGMQFEAFGQVRGRKTVRYRQPDST